MKVTGEQIEEEGICPTCRGNGSYGTETTDAEGNVTMEYKHCEDCNGTGFEVSNGDFD